MKKIIHNNIAYCSVNDAATYLKTTANKVRVMMGDGTLEYAQFKVNGKLFITEKSLVAKQRLLLEAKYS